MRTYFDSLLLMGNPIIRQKVQHGSLGYKILNYARFRSRQKDGTFSVEEYKEFIYGSVRPSYIGRAVDALVRNGHLQKMDNERYRFTDTGVLHELDYMHKNILFRKARNNKHSEARQELDDIHSSDF